MTYNISKQLQQITENKDAFQFDLNSYKWRANTRNLARRTDRAKSQ